VLRNGGVRELSLDVPWKINPRSVLLGGGGRHQGHRRGQDEGFGVHGTCLPIDDAIALCGDWLRLCSRGSFNTRYLAGLDGNLHGWSAPQWLDRFDVAEIEANSLLSGNKVERVYLTRMCQRV
jgi:hypothetical protein